MKALNVVIAVFFLQVNTGMASECRDAIVDAYGTLGSSIERDSFSNARFSDLEVTVQEFNEMDSPSQEAIYLKIRPLQTMVDATIFELNKQIDRYAGTFYEMYVLEELEKWRNAVDTLKICTTDSE